MVVHQPAAPVDRTLAFTLLEQRARTVPDTVHCLSRSDEEGGDAEALEVNFYFLPASFAYWRSPVEVACCRGSL